MAQKEIIRDKLLQDRQVSNYWAVENRVTLRLASIINLLRKEGYDIKTEMRGNECVYKINELTLF